MQSNGNPKTAWNAGGYPSQWIVIDLESDATIYSVRLLTGQNPAGPTVHQIVAWDSDTEPRVLHVFDGHTSDSQWLTYQPQDPISQTRYIAIETVSSPSWVSWFEIEVNGHAN